MKALIGLNLKKAKEVAKHELGVKRMGDARFKMILDEGVKRGDFIISGDMIESAGDPFDFFGIEEIEEQPPVEEEQPPVVDQTSYDIKTQTLHPEVVHLDPRLSSSDLPRPGDMYYYRSYNGEVVQGEVKSTICFAECQNPDGTWQSVAFQDLHLKKKGIPKETMLNHLRAYYQDNAHLRTECNRLDSERKKLTNEIEDLEAKVAELKKKIKDLSKGEQK